MATAMNESEQDIVGKLVYEPYSPVKCWKIVKDLGFVPAVNAALMVRKVLCCNLKGEKREFALRHLNDYDVLINDHRRKADKFEEIAKQLRQLSSEL